MLKLNEVLANAKQYVLLISSRISLDNLIRLDSNIPEFLEKTLYINYMDMHYNDYAAYWCIEKGWSVRICYFSTEFILVVDGNIVVFNGEKNCYKFMENIHLNECINRYTKYSYELKKDKLPEIKEYFKNKNNEYHSIINKMVKNCFENESIYDYIEFEFNENKNEFREDKISDYEIDINKTDINKTDINKINYNNPIKEPIKDPIEGEKIVLTEYRNINGSPLAKLYYDVIMLWMRHADTLEDWKNKINDMIVLIQTIPQDECYKYHPFNHMDSKILFEILKMIENRDCEDHFKQSGNSERQTEIVGEAVIEEAAIGESTTKEEVKNKNHSFKLSKEYSIKEICLFKLCNRRFRYMHTDMTDCYYSAWQLERYYKGLILYKTFENFKLYNYTYKKRYTLFSEEYFRVITAIWQDVCRESGVYFKCFTDIELEKFEYDSLDMILNFLETEITEKLKSSEFSMLPCLEPSMFKHSGIQVYSGADTILITHDNKTRSYELKNYLDLLYSNLIKLPYLHYKDLVNAIERDVGNYDKTACLVRMANKIDIQFESGKYMGDGVTRIMDLLEEIKKFSRVEDSDKVTEESSGTHCISCPYSWSCL